MVVVNTAANAGGRVGRYDAVTDGKRAPTIDAAAIAVGLVARDRAIGNRERSVRGVEDAAAVIRRPVI